MAVWLQIIGWTKLAGVAVVIIATLLTLYAGAAVMVALFHPDPRRRSDARAVLDRLTRLLRRPHR